MGMGHIDIQNWVPFAPNGLAGIQAGAAVVSLFRLCGGRRHNGRSGRDGESRARSALRNDYYPRLMHFTLYGGRGRLDGYGPLYGVGNG